MKLLDSGSGSAFDLLHSDLRAGLSIWLAAMGYQDVLLIDRDGNVICTLMKRHQTPRRMPAWRGYSTGCRRWKYPAPRSSRTSPPTSRRTTCARRPGPWRGGNPDADRATARRAERERCGYSGPAQRSAPDPGRRGAVGLCRAQVDRPAPQRIETATGRIARHDAGCRISHTERGGEIARALAQRAAEAADEIGPLITGSSRHVRDRVVAMRESGGAVETITRSASKISDSLADIACSAAQLETGIKDLNASLRDLDAATQRNPAMFDRTLAATTPLAQLIGGLNQLVSRFKGWREDEKAEVAAHHLRAAR